MIAIPFPPKLANAQTGTSVTIVSATVKAANELMGIGFVCERTILVKKVALRFGAISGTGDVTVSIQTTGSNGAPSGTSIVSQTIGIGTLTADAWNEITFTTTGTVNQGTRYVIDIRAGGTFTSSSIVLVQGYNQYSDASFLPYSYGTSAGTTTYTPSTSRFSENFVIIDNAGMPNCIGAFALDETGVALSTAGALEIGNRFKIATSLCSTFKVVGIRVSADSSAQTTPNIVVAVYDWNSGNNSTALQSDSFSPYTNNITGRALADYYFSSPATLSAGSEYIASIGLASSTATTIMTISTLVENQNAYKPILWDGTNDYSYDRVSRTSLTGSWTASTDVITGLQLMIEVVAFPSSGGGGYSANFNQGFGG